MKIEIKELKRINIKDGDIIFIPYIPNLEVEHQHRIMDGLAEAFKRRFPEKRFIVVHTDVKQINGIKVVNINEKK